MPDRQFVCGHVLHFKDGGLPVEKVLHKGTLEECQRIGEVCLAISYSGERPLDRAEFVVVPYEDEGIEPISGMPESTSPKTEADG